MLYLKFHTSYSWNRSILHTPWRWAKEDASPILTLHIKQLDIKWTTVLILSSLFWLQRAFRRSTEVPEVMDPLGARSQFLDIQTLPTWQQQQQQQRSGDSPSPSDQVDGLPSPQAFPSPFPFRPDINRKILLVWVTWAFLHIVVVVKKCLWFSSRWQQFWQRFDFVRNF